MLKYILLAAVFLAAVIVGNMLSGRLKERSHLLELISQLISQTAVQIRYLSPTFERLVKDMTECERYDELDFTKKTVEYAEQKDIRAAWKKAVTETRLPLNKDDIAILLTIGDFLGTSDTEGQLSMLETQLSVINAQKGQAADDYTRKGRMYRSVSLLIGIGICIMLF